MCSLNIFSQVVKNRFHRIFSPSQSLDTVTSSDLLFCFEVLSKDLAKERVVLLKVQQVHYFRHCRLCHFFFDLMQCIDCVHVLIFRDLRFQASQSQSALAA